MALRRLRGRSRKIAYGQWLRRRPRLAAIIEDLGGRRLVCSCTSKEGCLVEELQRYYEEAKVSQAPTVVYAGQGCPKHKCRKSRWSPPFKPHVDGTPSQCVIKNARWLLSDAPEAKELIAGLPELLGKQLVCDCEAGEPCHVEMLTWLANTAGARSLCGAKQFRHQALHNYCQFIQSPAQFFAPVPVKFPQEGFCKAIRKLFRQKWTEEWKPPVLEDIISGPPFTTYFTWLEDNEHDSSSPQPPAVLSKVAKSLRAVTEQNQRGHYFSSTPVAQTVGTGLEAQQHMEAATGHAKDSRFPMDNDSLFDPELACAAEWTLRNRSQLARARTRLFSAVRDLSNRLEPLTGILRKHQTGTVRKIAGHVNLGHP